MCLSASPTKIKVFTRFRDINRTDRMSGFPDDRQFSLLSPLCRAIFELWFRPESATSEGFFLIVLPEAFWLPFKFIVMRDLTKLGVTELRASEQENTSGGFLLIVAFLLPFLMIGAYQLGKPYIDSIYPDKFTL